jgi:hypothetical protein
MLTLNISYEVLSDRLITIKLPEEVSPGRHELVLVLDEKKLSGKNSKKLMEYAGSIPALKKIDGVAYQRELRSEWK